MSGVADGPALGPSCEGGGAFVQPAAAVKSSASRTATSFFMPSLSFSRIPVFTHSRNRRAPCPRPSSRNRSLSTVRTNLERRTTLGPSSVWHRRVSVTAPLEWHFPGGSALAPFQRSECTTLEACEQRRPYREAPSCKLGRRLGLPRSLDRRSSFGMRRRRPRSRATVPQLRIVGLNEGISEVSFSSSVHAPSSRRRGTDDPASAPNTSPRRSPFVGSDARDEIRARV